VPGRDPAAAIVSPAPALGAISAAALAGEEVLRVGALGAVLRGRAALAAGTAASDAKRARSLATGTSGSVHSDDNSDAESADQRMQHG
jgi:hypothetical protein